MSNQKWFQDLKKDFRSHNNDKHWWQFSQSLAQNHGIETLCLDESKLSVTAFDELCASIAEHPTLLEVSLKQCALTDAHLLGIQTLLESDRLRSLALSHNHFGPELIELITSHLETNIVLSHIDLTHSFYELLALPERLTFLMNRNLALKDFLLTNTPTLDLKSTNPSHTKFTMFTSVDAMHHESMDLDYLLSKVLTNFPMKMQLNLLVRLWQEKTNMTDRNILIEAINETYLRYIQPNLLPNNL